MIVNVNGTDRDLRQVDPEMPLLWALRDVLDLKGAKFGCGLGICGACTILMNGVAVQCCTITVRDAVGKRFTTIEGLSSDNSHPLQKAWIEEDVPQCGFCQPGFIMAAAGLLNTKPKPTDAEIDGAILNVCRCGTYPRIRKAIHRAAGAA